MGVPFGFVGELVVDDVGDVVHVQAARGHVGGHQESNGPLPELFHGVVPLCLRHVAVEGFGVVAVLHELVRHGLRLEPGAAEHEPEDVGGKVDQPLERRIAVFFLDHVAGVGNVVRSLVGQTGGNGHRPNHVCVGDLGGGFRHGGGKEPGSLVCGRFFPESGRCPPEIPC